MKKLLSTTALCMMSFGASAADLPSRVLAPAPYAAVVPFDAFGALSVGYNWATISQGGFSTDANGIDMSARATFAAPVFERFGFQADGEFNRNVYKISTGLGDLKRNSADLAGHAFWRDSSVGLLGVIAQAVSNESSLGILSDRRYFLGAEGQYFIGNVTLYGQAAYENANFGLPLASGVTADGVIVAAQARYFATPNWSVALKGSYESIKASFVGNNINHKGWLVGAQTDYRFDNTPYSVFATADYRDGKFSNNGGKDHETRVMLGGKLNFGSKTLFERDRSGASLDPIRSLQAVIPLVGGQQQQP
ncbi:MAG: hypothetical protein JWM36_3149 [Hyphomicrobiales bacterium]|nr:hypothetical protein [Hyphomicrobiales bacterium]